MFDSIRALRYGNGRLEGAYLLSPQCKSWLVPAVAIGGTPSSQAATNAPSTKIRQQAGDNCCRSRCRLPLVPRDGIGYRYPCVATIYSFE